MRANCEVARKADVLRYRFSILDFSPHSDRSQNHPGLNSSLHLRRPTAAETGIFQAIRIIGIIEYGCRAKKPEIVPFCYEGHCLFLSNDTPEPRSEVAVGMQLRWIALVYAACEHPAGQGRARWPVSAIWERHLYNVYLPKLARNLHGDGPICFVQFRQMRHVVGLLRRLMSKLYVGKVGGIDARQKPHFTSTAQSTNNNKFPIQAIL